MKKTFLNKVDFDKKSSINDKIDLKKNNIIC